MIGFGLATDPQEAVTTAIQAAEQAYELAPNDPEVLDYCALVWIQTSQYEKAVTALKRAVKIAPFDFVGWGYLALAHVSAGGEDEVREASRILGKILAEAPDHPSAAYWYEFQTAGLLRMKRYSEAVQAGRRSVELQPGYVSSQALLAEAYCRNGQPAEARRILNLILQYNPKFTVEQFQKLIMPMCRSEETVHALSGCCMSLGGSHAEPR
jgi:tetratricopeptide (TPR) repeat protein